MEDQLSGVTTWIKATRCGGYTGEDGEACVLVAIVETTGGE
ncbi:hypothetical protein [Actinoallomurus sp. NPDC050550]